MDRLIKIKLGSKDEYVPGDCNVCHQKNVKVKPLFCKNHYYCRMCVEFVPRLQKGDFSCKACSERSRKLDDENKERVDTFLKKQTGMQQDFKEVAIGIRGAQVVTFVDEEETNKDLGGNNEEWDHLLQSMSQNEQKMSTKVIKPEVENSPDRRRLLHRRREVSNAPVPTDNNVKRIPRKSSFVRLVLPTAGWTYGCQDFISQRQPFSSSGTELVQDRHPVDRHLFQDRNAVDRQLFQDRQPGDRQLFQDRHPADRQLFQDRQPRDRQLFQDRYPGDRQLFRRRSRHSFSSNDARSSSGSNGDAINADSKRSTEFRNYQDQDIEDALEIERGTSPCKSLRTRVRRIHVNSTESSSSSGSTGDPEIDGLKKEIGKIETTPLFQKCSPPFEDMCPVEERDDFWDF